MMMKPRLLHVLVLLLFRLCIASSLLKRVGPTAEELDQQAADDKKSPPRKVAASSGRVAASTAATDQVEDSIYDPIQGDYNCKNNGSEDNCEMEWEPPISMAAEDLEQQERLEEADDADGVETCENNATAQSSNDTSSSTAGGGGEEESNNINKKKKESAKQQKRHHNDDHDDHTWGFDPHVKKLRRQLLNAGLHNNSTRTVLRRPPIFLMPGLASTRLVAWRYKACPAALCDIKVQDHVWLNINLLIQMSALDKAACLTECLKLGIHQTDFDDPASGGCKLRPDEGLDAISSLSPGGLTPNLLVGGTNTVYAWLIQWLSDNLGYDVTNIIGLPYDWRLSPDRMEARDGFLTLTRKKMEAAVISNGGAPGVVVAHSMGNTIFRYFLDWLRVQLREEVYDRYVRQAKRRLLQMTQQQQQHQQAPTPTSATTLSDESTNVKAKTAAAAAAIGSKWILAATQKGAVSAQDIVNSTNNGTRNEQLWQLAMIEGDANWHEWIELHIWTYVGLSAPLLGAVNPLRAVISGENMGLPFSDEVAREMERTFGSTLTISPLSAKSIFCDEWDITDRWDEEESAASRAVKQRQHAESRLACIDDIVNDIELSKDGKLYQSDPWASFPSLKKLLLQRMDWDTDLPMIRIVQETCQDKEKSPCRVNTTVDISPKEIESGDVYLKVSRIWHEKNAPMRIKQEQLRASFWDTKVPNPLNQTWERPLIKHVIMAYGVDIATEVGYEYFKVERNATATTTTTTTTTTTAAANGTSTASSSGTNKKSDSGGGRSYDTIPVIRNVYWETAGGQLEREPMNSNSYNPISGLWGKKRERQPLRKGSLDYSGDGSVPYLSLAFAQTWLLHGLRARRYDSSTSSSSSQTGTNDGGIDSDTSSGGGNNNNNNNPLDEIEISHRPQDGTAWKKGPPPTKRFLGAAVPDEKKRVAESSETGTMHPHGTKYKPAMVRYRTSGTSRTTGIVYTTSVIEAAMVEHKETTRNFDILAAVFGDVVKFMHDDLSLLSSSMDEKE